MFRNSFWILEQKSRLQLLFTVMTLLDTIFNVSNVPKTKSKTREWSSQTAFHLSDNQ